MQSKETMDKLKKQTTTKTFKGNMHIFNVTQYNEGGTSGVRIGFLWVFSITITHNENQGKHLTIGLGLRPMEVGLQLSLWRL